MKRFLLGSILLFSAAVLPVPATAEVNINIGFPLPPLIAFPAPPDVIVVPDAIGVYVVPDIEVDLFFWNGWWWRPWQGRWYRSRYYDRGWVYYGSVPRFYFDVDPGWRTYYRDRDWHGHRWEFERIPNRRLERDWKTWDRTRHWERRGTTWGVRDYRPPPQSEKRGVRRERQMQYEQRPEVRQHRLERQEQQRRPPGGEPRGDMEGRPPAQRLREVPQGPREPRDDRGKPRGERRQKEPDREKPDGGPEGRGPERGR